MTYTIFSKRNLLKLVENQLVNGWSDPRITTISGLFFLIKSLDIIFKFVPGA